MRPSLPTRYRVQPKLLELDARILPSFTPLATFTTGLVSPSVATRGDFNGDGRDDLAVYNSSGGPGAFISILLSSGDGQFTQSAALTGDAGFPTALISADFNGDGIADLAAGSVPASTMRVFLGNGDGTFAQSFTVNISTLGLGSGDFNGDGRTDLVALQNPATPNLYRIYLGNGLGGFTAQAPVNTTLDDSQIATGDLDGNGTVDFVSTNSAGTIVAYLGSGDGTFGAAIVTVTATTSGIGDFALGRFDADALPDIVTLEGSKLVLHRNLGGGAFDAAGVPFFNFASSGVRLASVDFNSDGYDDVVANDVFGDASVLYGSAAGAFAPDGKNPYPIGFFGSELTTGDFNGDRHPDFTFLGSSSPTGIGRVFLNDLPDSTSTTLTVNPSRTALGTPVTLTATVAPRYLGHDPAQGTVTFTAGSAVLGTATLANGVGTLTVSSLPAGTYSIVATYSGSPAEFDDSGNVVPTRSALLASQSAPAALVILSPGFVVGTDNGPVVVLRDRGGIAEERYGDFSAPFPGVRPAIGDFNGDGISDVVGGSGPGLTAQVTIVDGVTHRAIFAVQPFDGFAGGVFVASADFNGDGIADFAVGADAGGEPRICVYVSSGGTFVQVASFYAFDRRFAGGVRLAAGDIDGDGTPDLIVGAGPGAGPAVAVFDGKALLTGVDRRLIEDFYAYDAGFNGGVFVAAGDVNRDGFADIITGAGLGAPHVTAVSGLSLVTGGQQLLASFYAGDRTNRGGIRVAAHELDGDGYSEIIAGAGVGNGSTIWGFSGLTLLATPTDQPETFFADDVFPGLFAGVYVG